MIDHTELKILIVEDDPVIATDIRSLLTHNGYKVAGVAKNATRAFDLLHNLQPNFAIVDIHLGSGPSGIDVAEVIHEKYQFPYIFLTSFSDPETLSAAQEQGPFGYLVKPFQDQTLLTTISVAWNNYLRIKDKENPGSSAFMVDLTKQERRICRLLLKGMSYKQICEEIDISVNTLKFHVKNIYIKLDVAGRSELVGLFHS